MSQYTSRNDLPWWGDPERDDCGHRINRAYDDNENDLDDEPEDESDDDDLEDEETEEEDF